jgi:hypothetical protein
MATVHNNIARRLRGAHLQGDDDRSRIAGNNHLRWTMPHNQPGFRDAMIYALFVGEQLLIAIGTVGGVQILG